MAGEGLASGFAKYGTAEDLSQFLQRRLGAGPAKLALALTLTDKMGRSVRDDDDQPRGDKQRCRATTRW